MSRLTSSRSLCHALCVSHQHLVPLPPSLYVFDSLAFSLITVSLSLVAAFYLSFCLFLTVSRSLHTFSPSLLPLGLFSLCLFTHGVQGGSRLQKRGRAVREVGWEAQRKRQKGTKHKEEGFQDYQRFCRAGKKE